MMTNGHNQEKACLGVCIHVTLISHCSATDSIKNISILQVVSQAITISRDRLTKALKKVVRWNFSNYCVLYPRR